MRQLFDVDLTTSLPNTRKPLRPPIFIVEIYEFSLRNPKQCRPMNVSQKQTVDDCQGVASPQGISNNFSNYVMRLSVVGIIRLESQTRLKTIRKIAFSSAALPPRKFRAVASAAMRPVIKIKNSPSRTARIIKKSQAEGAINVRIVIIRRAEKEEILKRVFVPFKCAGNKIHKVLLI